MELRKRVTRKKEKPSPDNGVSKTPSPNISYHFCKVFLKQITSQVLPIPRAFVERFELPSRVKLRDHYRKLWNVGLEEEEGDVLLSTGWPVFAYEHCLEHGDYLIFKYDGISCFDVKVYGKNGCRKERRTEARKKNTIIDMTTKKQQQTRKPTRELGTSRSRNQPKAPKALEAVNNFSSQHPFFKIAIWESYQLYNDLTVPFWFAPNLIKDADSTEKERMVKLQTNDGTWEMKFTVNPNRRMCKLGWLTFAKENRLMLEDACVFELMDSDAGVLKVRIFRRTDFCVTKVKKEPGDGL